MLLYGCLVWWRSTEIKYLAKRLDRVQRLACLAISGALRSTPTAALEWMLGLLPLSLLARREAMMAAYRLVGAGHWRGGGVETFGHRAAWPALCRVLPMANETPDRLVKQFSFSKTYQVDFPSRAGWESDYDRLCPRDAIVCFTDGSVVEGLGGAGVFSSTLNLAISEMVGVHSVFQAELLAIRRCASAILLLDNISNQIIICSDSKAALGALAQVEFKSKAVLDCAEELRTLALRCPVLLRWVPGHTGIEGNEAADRLANTAASSEGPRRLDACPTTAVIRRALNDHFETAHSELWRRRQDCRQARAITGKWKANLRKRLCLLSRCNLRLLVQVSSGHSLLNRHASFMGLSDTAICPYCQMEEETSLHFLGDCPAFALCRSATLGDFTVPLGGGYQTLTPSSLLRFINASGRFQE